MGERVRVVRHRDGLVALKEGPAHDAEAVRAEAQVLASVQGPGVVELVGLSDAEPPALLTRWVGSRSLAEVPVPMAPDRAAALCLAVAGTLGRLHRSGFVHGGLDPTHVLLDPDGRPVLCGFGSAGPIGAPVRRPATDPGQGDDGGAPGDGEALRPALDVAGLGRVLHHLLGPTSPARHGPGWNRAARGATARHRALRALADHATTGDPAAQPSLAAFSHTLRRAAPDADLRAGAPEPATSPPTASPGRSERLQRRGRSGRRAGRPDPLPAVLGVLAVAAATYFGLSAWWAPSTERRADASPVVARSAPTTTTTSTTAPVPVVAPVVEHDGRRFAVGTAGDVVLVAPWLCDGDDLPVVLHPSDGTIHLFDRWAEPGGSMTARTVASVAGASDLDRAGRADCPELLVSGAAGTLSILTAEDLR